MLKRFTNFQEPNCAQQCMYKFVHVEYDETVDKVRTIKVSVYPDELKGEGLLYEKEFTFTDLQTDADTLLLTTEDYALYEKV